MAKPSRKKPWFSKLFRRAAVSLLLWAASVAGIAVFAAWKATLPSTWDRIAWGLMVAAAVSAAWAAGLIFWRERQRWKAANRTPEQIRGQIWEWADAHDMKVDPSEQPEKEEDFRLSVQPREFKEWITVVKRKADPWISFAAGVGISGALLEAVRDEIDVFRKRVAIELLRLGVGYTIEMEGEVLAVRLNYPRMFDETMGPLSFVESAFLITRAYKIPIALAELTLFEKQSKKSASVRGTVL